jgi:hypothetical protein
VPSTKVGNDVKVTLGLPNSITVTASLATNAESASEAAHASTASVADRATTLSADATASFADLWIPVELLTYTNTDIILLLISLDHFSFIVKQFY